MTEFKDIIIVLECYLSLYTKRKISLETFLLALSFPRYFSTVKLGVTSSEPFKC